MDEISPDQNEEELADDTDNLVPTRGYQMLPVVGLGASAGGVEALRRFFLATPPDTGLAFVVVTHLSPEHESLLPEILQRDTKMRVIQVSQTIRVAPDTVYVIPPRKALRTMDGHLQLADLPSSRYRHVAVDQFFRTLADTHGPHATAIVLSGADGDGAIGIKRIKERGGLTIAQDPDEAENGAMPRSAIATGMVDWVLCVEQMPAHVLQYYRMERAVRLPPEGPVRRHASLTDTADELALRDVLSFLRSRTGRDFTSYKRATIVRRIGRRMQVNNVHDLNGYLECLRTRPGESGALFQDLLISVTNFFRDPECFAALEEQVPRLFIGKSGADAVRVWVAGCATGEEAYSIAMLLAEHARTLDSPPSIQIFATDLDDNAIKVAREGVYPTTIEADISEDRLRRFFIKEPRGFRVRRELRETVLFAVHDLLRDSPFSRLDMVSSRNILIYLNREAQARVLDTFHFALLSGGLLYLGPSESVEDGTNQFHVVDKKHRLFTKSPTSHGGLPIPSGPNTLALAEEAQLNAGNGPVVPLGPLVLASSQPTRRALNVEGRSISWGELHLKLLEQLAPASLLIDSDHDVVHMSPSAGDFLRFSGGEPTRNLLRLVHPSIRIELRSALYEAINTAQRVVVPRVRVEDDQPPLSIEVAPMDSIVPGLVLVLLRTLEDEAGAPVESTEPWLLPSGPTEQRIAHQLDLEVERLKSRLRDTVEQYETSTEELRASNEELQAMNEELRSATEELETSREELQSINEELTTVNHELKSKVDELGHSNSDMQNLMDATAIATVFLDRGLAITRFTPSAIALFNLIPSDVGRPLAHLRTKLEYPELADDAAAVLARLVPIEREVKASPDAWFLVRMLPYRTQEDRIAGVVLTFVDISDRKQGQEALRRSEERFSAIVNQASVGVVQADLSGKITFANHFFADLLGYEDGELVGRALVDLLHPDERAESVSRMAQLASDGKSFDREKRCLSKQGSYIWLHQSVSALADGHGHHASVIVVCNDISERKHAEDALRESAQQLREALNENEAARRALEAADGAKDRFLAVLSHELRNPLASISAAASVIASQQSGDAERQRAAKIVQRQALTMKALLDDLLDISRLSLGRLQLQRRPVALSEIIESALESARGIIDASEHRLQINTTDAPITIDADPVRISQVLANLLINAAKYTPRGGSITLTVSEAESRAVLQITDNGIGMKPDQIESMFEMFSQSAEARSRDGAQGLGIGLALVRSIVELHDGMVNGYSDGEGKGSRFTVELPIATHVATMTTARDDDDQQATTASTRRLRVLVVDDNDDAAWSIAQLLSAHDVATATNGNEALQRVDEWHPDVAVVDLGLRGISGHDVARQIRERPDGGAMLLIAGTGWGQAEDRERSRQAGFDAHLVKPIDLQELKRVINTRFHRS